MNLPQDVKAYVRGNILKKVGEWLFFTLVTGLFILLFNGSFKEAEAGVRAFVYVALLLIPFFVTKMPKLIFDSSFEGNIEKIYADDGIGNTSKAIPRLETAMRVAEVTATVRLSSGKTKDIVLYSGKFDKSVADTLNKYQVGNKVIHIRGVKHNQIITAEGVTCIVCGHFNKSNRKTCAECGSSLNLLNH